MRARLDRRAPRRKRKALMERAQRGEHMKFPRRATLPLLLAVATGVSAQEYWTHNSMTGSLAQQQLTADHGGCTAAAYRTVGNAPSPRQAPNPPAPTGQYVEIQTPSGLVTGYTYPTTPPPVRNPFWEGVQDARARSDYQSTFNSIYYGCMAGRGWTVNSR